MTRLPLPQGTRVQVTVGHGKWEGTIIKSVKDRVAQGREPKRTGYMDVVLDEYPKRIFRFRNSPVGRLYPGMPNPEMKMRRL